jgi:hypothetical protein
MKITSKDHSNGHVANVGGNNIRMTAAMKEGLEALQREYDAFRESSFQTLALISNMRIAPK